MRFLKSPNHGDTMITTTKFQLGTLSETTQYRLKKILSRDTRVIGRVLNLLEENEKALFKKTKRGNHYSNRKDLVDLFVSTANRPDVNFSCVC